MIRDSQLLTNPLRQTRNLGGVVVMLLCMCNCASAGSKSPSPFSDVPHGDWAYTALKQIEKAGVHVSPSICFPSGRGRQYDLDHRTLTRYEFAVITQRVLATLQHEKQSRAGRQTAQQIALQTTANKLAGEFSRELTQLNRH